MRSITADAKKQRRSRRVPARDCSKFHTKHALARSLLQPGMSGSHVKPQPTKEPRGMSPVTKVVIAALTAFLLIWAVFA